MSNSTTASQHAGFIREVQFEHSRDFAPLLAQSGASLLVSTYQAGKLVAVSVVDGQLRLAFHNFEQAMGIALSAERLAVGTARQVWFLHRADDGPQLTPGIRSEAGWITRSSFVTGNIHCHDMGWGEDGLWVVNTLFSNLSTLHNDYSWVPRWQPPFITALRPEDRCHLNGLAIENGHPRFVTAMSETDSKQGWRPTKAHSGVIIDVPSGETIARGFAMPHSPRLYDGHLFVLNSGLGNLSVVDPQTGTVEAVEQFPGYTRGLSFCGPFAFVGLSRIRETSTFDGIPIAEKRNDLRCGVAVVDLRSGKSVAYLEFKSGVEEIFDVQVLPGVRDVSLVGPHIQQDDTKELWIVPSPDQARLVTGGLGAIQRPRRAPSGGTVNPAAASLLNQANQYLRSRQFAEARESYSRALQMCPGFALAHTYIASALQHLGCWDDAQRHLESALRIDPTLPETHLEFSKLCLARQQWQTGWKEYEWRWHHKDFAPPPPLMGMIAPVWDGSDLTGKSILIYGEQGIGDDLMFASCFADIIGAADRCVVCCRPRLVSLFERSFPEAHVRSSELLGNAEGAAEIGRVDWQIAAGSLPLHLRNSDNEFPGTKFLNAEPNQVTRFTSRLEQLGSGAKVGVSWRGGATLSEQKIRSTTLDMWKPILNIPDVVFVNVQYGDCQPELDAIHRSVGIQIHNLPGVDALNRFDELTSLVAALDAVVSVDNSTIHVAGGLGTRSIGMLPLASETSWRWGIDRQDSLWYSSVSLFRQTKTDDWESVIQQAADRLALRFSDSGYDRASENDN